MLFEVKDTGEELPLNISEELFCLNNGNGVLHHSQVTIIFKENLRRIYIWKGVSSSVRKKFIASQVATRLQQELMNSLNYPHCKIVSVDQGDEPNEFLDAFGFKRNSINNDPSSILILNQLDKTNINYNSFPQVKEEKTNDIELKNIDKSTNNQSSYKMLKKNQQSRKILEKVLSISIPDNYTRKNILIGRSDLYGNTIKKAEIFNEHLVKKEWEKISPLPRKIFELDSHKHRIHFNTELGEIEAIEILERVDHEVREHEPKVVIEKLTVKELKQYCRENQIKVPASYRKADIVQLVKNFTS
ncbi:MAG: hypothetical protein ACFE8N_01035 [Promethearchaeota archaeon]